MILSIEDKQLFLAFKVASLNIKLNIKRYGRRTAAEMTLDYLRLSPFNDTDYRKALQTAFGK